MTKAMERTCSICGAAFFGWQTAKYCSETCRETGTAARKRAHYIKRNRQPAPPQERHCRKCGGVFLSRWNAAYCDDCLHDGSAYMNQLRWGRKNGDDISAIEWRNGRR